MLKIAQFAKTAALGSALFGWLQFPAVSADIAIQPGVRGIGYASSMRLACENGREYPIRAVAVSDLGDLVSGYLVTAPRHNVHIRLVPMGDGYRYAGRGVWFDGLRDSAVLTFQSAGSVPCVVMQN
jgi:hypothetical protein